MLGGLLIPVFSLGLLGLFDNLVVMLVGMFFFFFGWSLRDPAFQSSMNENVKGSKSGIIFAISFFCFFGGNLIANIFVTTTSSLLTHQNYFLIFSGFYLLQFLFIAIFYKELKHNHAAISKPDSTIKDIPRLSLKEDFLKNPTIRPMFLFFLFDSFIWGTGTMLLNGALFSQLNIFEDKIAIILMGYNLSVLLTQIPLGKLIDKIGTKKAIILAEISGLIFYGITILGALFQGNFQIGIIFTGQIFYGIAVAFYIPAQVVFFTNSNKDKAAETYGIGNLLIGLGTFPATMVAGVFIEKIHFIAPLVFAVIFIPINMLIFMPKFKNSFQISKKEN